MAESELLCDLCGAASKLFCFCKGVKTKLCKVCESMHYKKHPKAKHQTFVIGAFLFVEQPQDFEEYLDRSRNVKQVVGMIENAELRLGEECERVSLELESEEVRLTHLIKETLEASRADLTELYANTISKLQLLKSRIYSTLRFRALSKTDVSHKLVQDPSSALQFVNSFSLVVKFKTDKITKLMEKYCVCYATNNVEHPGEERKRMFWSDADGIPRLFSLNVSQRTIGIFNPHRQTMCQHIIKADVSLYEYSSWCLAEQSRLAICGGYNEHALLVDPLSTEVQILPQMLRPRRRGGLLYHDGQLLMFGGYKSDYLCEVERFDFARQTWSEVGRMLEARSAICPVEFHGRVVLVGDGSHQVEQFWLESGKFEAVKTYLPFDSWATVFCVNNQILILQRSRMIALTAVEGSTQYSKHETELEIDNWWYSQSPPVSVDGKCFFLRYGEIWAFAPSAPFLLSRLSG